MTAPLPKNPPPGALRAHLELLRLPNVFTAMADVLLGFWFTHSERTDVLLLLVAASSSLYLAGMVLNDVCDVAQDTAERPGRPIPSGRISLSRARGIGWTLLVIGVALGWSVSLLTGEVRSGMVASALAVLVFAYDAVLKRTPLGPLAMGGCRMLNVLLGMSAFGGAWQSYHVVVAGGLGLYIVGVTLLARREAAAS
ncbi:MAG: UbiA family prenyltransferase, partial [Planctomycetes bacterium]|nr:UbiA family prenyltransferase [Planctomycetota bacterium]